MAWKEPLESIEKVGKQTLEATERVEAKVDRMASDRRGEQKKAFLERHLCTPAHEKNIALHGQYEEDTLKSSGGWLLGEDKFKNWSNRTNPLLWVSGGPGTGKSFLASTTISHLRSLYPQDASHPSRISVAYFFIKGYDQDLQELGPILKSIAYQISQVDTVFQSHAINVFNKPDATATPRKLWQNLFLNFFNLRDLSNATLIVFDGLDEAPRETVKALISLVEDVPEPGAAQSRLSVALFARPEIAEHFDSKFQRNLWIVEVGERNEADIASYVKQNVLRIEVVKEAMRLKTKKIVARLARDIRDKIMAKADGMFFKVVLIMNQLYDKEKVPAVFAAIEAAPPELEQMISHVFERLIADEDVDKADLKELLLWVCFAKRPLTIAELYAALEARTGQAYDALESRLRGRFASLFKIRGPTSKESGDRAPAAKSEASDYENFDIDDASFDDDDEEETLAVGSDKSAIAYASKNDSLSDQTVERFWRNEVQLTHISIRDFLVNHPDGKMNNRCIAVDARTAEAHIVSVLMQRMATYQANADELTFDHYAGKFVTDIEKSAFAKVFHEDDLNLDIYTGQFLTDHMNAIDSKSLTEEEKQPIIRNICSIFFDEVGVKSNLEMTCFEKEKTINRLFEDPKFVRLLRKEWLASASELKFSKEEWEWIRKAVASQKDFLRPLAMQAAKLWLTAEHEKDLPLADRRKLYFIWIAYCFLQIVRSPFFLILGIYAKR